MRAIMPEVLPEVLELRRRTGADRWDEMWEGELHMPPAPSVGHQESEGELEAWLRSHWARSRGRRVYHNVNLTPVGGWPDDYRIPDLILLTPRSKARNRGDYVQGAPAVVIEICSPGDETLEKLPFYAKLGVPEVWVIDRDTRAPEIYVLRGEEYECLVPAADGWLHSAATGIQLRGQRRRKLAIQIAGDKATLQLLPEN